VPEPDRTIPQYGIDILAPPLLPTSAAAIRRPDAVLDRFARPPSGRLALHISLDWTVLGKVLAVALAVGLDVLAISIGVGVAGVATQVRYRLGIAFASAEIAMQFIGYQLGRGAGAVLGELANFVAFALLAFIGSMMIRSALGGSREGEFDNTRGVGLLTTSLAISLDSLGVGVALPAARIPLGPTLVTVSITTTIFTLVGLAFGGRLGKRFEHQAEGIAGGILIILAIAFLVEHLI
jgi:putative Mn2+ efflux pump MntP